MPRSAEAELQASEERFHRLVDAVSDYAILMLDASGRVATWNAGAEKTKGYRPEEIIGKHFSVFYTPEDRAAGKPEMILETVRREGRIEDEGWRVRKDGTRFWANVVITALRDPQGAVTGFAKVTRDLTQRRAVEEKLHASEERFHHLVDAVTDYAIFILDPTGHVATWNAGARKTKGYSPEEIIGEHFSVFYTAEDRAAGKPERVLETVRREGRWEEENWRVRKDGTRFWASVAITALRDQQGEVTGFAKVTRDLTARRTAEENERALAREQLARAASEHERRRLLTLLEQVPAVVNFLRGPDLVFEFAHPRAIALLGGRDVTGEPLAAAAPGDAHRPYVERVRRVYETGEPFVQNDVQVSMEVDGRAVDTHWDSVYVPVRDAGGRIEGVMTFDLDVTEGVRARQAAERANQANVAAREELERLNRAKDEFLATMSHELRTPLNAMLGWATMLRRRPRDEAQLDRGLEVIERNAKTQERLVSDLLDVSRIISGKLRLALRRTELPTVIHAAADVVRPAAEGKGVRLVVDVDPAMGATVADADRLQQVLWNLLINAVKFTPPGGRIVVTGDRTHVGQRIRVEDTGAGIPPEHLAHIFERFRQVDSSMTRSHGGLGLGLAIVRHLVEAHGGSVQAHSEGAGRGATFTVVLPVHAVDTSSIPAEPAAGAPARPDTADVGSGPERVLANVRVLVIDDDEDSLELLRVVLEGAGAEVTTAASARAALETRGQFDVILSDIGMPEMDGYTLMQRIRSRDSRAGVPAIALTAYARAEDAERALRAGYQEHLAKPVDPGKLLDAVQTWSQTRSQGVEAL